MLHAGKTNISLMQPSSFHSHCISFKEYHKVSVVLRDYFA
jgi:hypothetical protein